MEAYSCSRKIVIKLQWLRVFERMSRLYSVSLRGVVLHITMPSRGGTGGKEQGVNRALGCRKQLLWSRVRATTPLHRERSSLKGKGPAGPVQWCRECEPVRRHAV